MSEKDCLDCEFSVIEVDGSFYCKMKGEKCPEHLEECYHYRRSPRVGEPEKMIG